MMSLWGQLVKYKLDIAFALAGEGHFQYVVSVEI